MKNMDVLIAHLVGKYCPCDFFKASKGLQEHMENKCTPEGGSCRECWTSWLEKEVCKGHEDNSDRN